MNQQNVLVFTDDASIVTKGTKQEWETKMLNVTKIKDENGSSLEAEKKHICRKEY